MGDFLEKLKQEHLEKRKQSSQTPRWFAEEMEDSQSLHRRDSNRVADDEYLAMLGRSLTMDVAETNADAAGGGKDELFDLDIGDDDEATEVPFRHRCIWTNPRPALYRTASLRLR